ncbi:uncharacterized protein LTR77_007386 [Saxophila tyrrhenica]|uniref:Uncharacterized protein n=1 Tax=Saxophila tyrrhenica TaxID=1690608 RepID=A0AAV9P8D0_9PEZI|nr:hypothetical protein LTR77_007386 [Saxophila tyrrhenica]
MSVVKTYILAPNFSFQPDGSIKIGNIIAEPFRPTKPLSALDLVTNSIEIITTTELQSSIRKVKSRSGHGSIWAQFLQTASGHVGAGKSTDRATSYESDSLDTIQLKYDPTEDQVTPLLQNSKVLAAMNAGIFGRQPVYMITGLKIARGFSMKNQVTTNYEVSTGFGVPVTDQISVGFDVGRGHGNEVETSFRSANDIIFAYQLHKIALKGRKTTTTNVDVYAPKSAFLHDDDDERDRDVAIVNPASADDVDEALAADESTEIEVANVMDGEEEQARKNQTRLKVALNLEPQHLRIPARERPPAQKAYSNQALPHPNSHSFRTNLHTFTDLQHADRRSRSSKTPLPAHHTTSSRSLAGGSHCSRRIMSDYIDPEFQGDALAGFESMDNFMDWDGGEDWVPDWVGVEDDAAQGR